MIYKKSWKYILFRTKGCVRLYKLKAVKDFSDVCKNYIGGYVGGYHNLSQTGNCWIYDEAIVSDKARVSENAIVTGKAIVFDNSIISGNAQVCDKAQIYGNANICGITKISGNTMLSGNIIISE